ncbi:MAG: lipopolysaccharide heptosyltransferase I [Gammaproteobacteria bacterium]
MLRVLIVKLSSMGDLIHALPAVTDASKRIPNIRFDWVVDEGFADIPSGHPAVDRIIKSAHRRWRKNMWQTLKNGEVLKFIKTLRTHTYDYIIDVQANHKSAAVTRLARGVRCGYDRANVREKGLVHFAYGRHFAISKKEHAITRMRKLFAQALNYSFDMNEVDYGFQASAFSNSVFDVPEKSLIFVHNTSWSSKSWPQSHWRALIDMAASAGYNILLTWGNAAEKRQAEQIAAKNARAIVLPDLRIAEFIPVAAQVKGAVCMDTGFGHIIAALKIPAVTLFGPSDPELVGAHGPTQVNLAAKSCQCFRRTICHDNQTPRSISTCLAAIKPELVWQKLSGLLKPNK